MKALFISYNLSLNERINTLLDKHFIRGYSKWPLTHGRGSVDGEPHMGTHAWPAMNASILAVVEDKKIKPVLEELRNIDNQAKQHGVRAFVWEITDQM